MRILILTTFALCALTLSAETARADYLCFASLQQPSGNLGDFGSISIRLNSAPDCGGSTIGYFSICSLGASDSACPASAQWHMTELGLFHLWDALHQAQLSNERLTRWSVPCGANAGSTCIGSINFYAN